MKTNHKMNFYLIYIILLTHCLLLLFRLIVQTFIIIISLIMQLFCIYFILTYCLLSSTLFLLTYWLPNLIYINLFLDVTYQILNKLIAWYKLLYIITLLFSITLSIFRIDLFFLYNYTYVVHWVITWYKKF